jgi:hypothetical protein
MRWNLRTLGALAAVVAAALLGGGEVMHGRFGLLSEACKADLGGTAVPRSRAGLHDFPSIIR